MAEVRNPSGQLLTNAPVTFAVPQGSGQLAATAEMTAQSNVITTRSGSTGKAMAYLTFPALQNHASSISATAGAAGHVASKYFQFRTNDVPVLPPVAPPSPTPSPDPSATPPPPLHYALIDLGKGVFPSRIENNGWVLVARSDLGACRWRNGVLEPLSYSDPSIYWEAKDINSTGTVVGTLYPPGDISSGQDTEVAAGLIWEPGNSVAQTKVSAPFLATTPAFDPPVQVRGARFNAVSDAGTIFGGIYTGLGYTSLRSGLPFEIVNHYRWSANGTGAQALTRGTASQVGYSGSWPIYQLNGAVADPSQYTDVRANSAGHYVGRMFVPGINPSWPTPTGMVDGRSVSYQPVDINESGIVAAYSEDYSGMVVINADGTRRDIAGANPAAINAFVRSGVDSQGQAKAIPAPQIIGWWFKDYVSGWLPSVWEYAPNGEWAVHTLDELIVNSAGWFIPNFNVQDINDEGVIVGYGGFTDPTNPQAQDEGHGFMLVPVKTVYAFFGASDVSDNEIDPQDIYADANLSLLNKYLQEGPKFDATPEILNGLKTFDGEHPGAECSFMKSSAPGSQIVRVFTYNCIRADRATGAVAMQAMKDALATDGAYVTFNGHANMGAGPAFTLDVGGLSGFMHVSNPNPLKPAAVSAAVLQEEHYSFMFRPYVPGDPDNEILESGTNYIVPIVDKPRFPDIPPGTTLNIQGNGSNAYHFEADIRTEPEDLPQVRKFALVKGSSSDLPVLRYKWFFFDACNSGRDYIEVFEHGSFFYTTTLSGDIDTTKIFVEAIVENKQSTDTVRDLNSVYDNRPVNDVYEFNP